MGSETDFRQQMRGGQTQTGQTQQLGQTQLGQSQQFGRSQQLGQSQQSGQTRQLGQSQLNMGQSQMSQMSQSQPGQQQSNMGQQQSNMGQQQQACGFFAKDSFPDRRAQYKLEEENCNLRNISEALSTLNKWIHSQQKFVKERSTSIPEAKSELLQFKAELRAGMVQLEEREIHVTVTLNSAQKQILKVEEQSHQEGIQKMATQVKENWEKLRKNFEKLASNVDAALNSFALNDIKLQEMYQWAVNFYKMVTASIEDSITLVYEEQLYLLKSYEYQISEKVKVLVTLKITEAMEDERYSALYVKIEAVIAKMNTKIEERKEELEITISQLEEFEIAVDKALAWMTEQELILKQIVVIQDEESLELLVTQKEEVYELIDHVKDKMESIESVLETGEEIGLKEMKRFSLYTKLVNLKTRWTQLDVDCHQKIIQIELNIISIKEYKLLQWLVKQEERLTVNIEILERVELEEILALYKEYKEDYEEVRALYLELKDKVDLVEGEELERDIRIIETHWVNVYELLIAAFAVVSAREEADTESEEETEIDSSSAARRKGGFAFDIEFGDEEKEPQEMVPVRDEPGTILAPDINVNVENKPVLESSAPAPQVMGGGWDGNMPDINISVQGGNVAMVNSAAPGAERVSSSSSSEHKKQESKDNGDNRFNIMNSGSFNGFGGGAGLPLQLPMLPQLQYNQGVGNHVCCGGNNSVTEVDSSKFLSAIVDLRSWITSHLQELMHYNNPDIDAQLQWLTDLNQVLMNQEVTIQDTHSTIKMMLPKLSLTAKDQLISQIEGMLNDFSELKSLVNSRLLAVREKKAECADFEDTMAEFEEELIDAEETFDKIKGRIYNFDEIIVNIESLAELEGKLELWRSLFDKGVEGAGCPPSLQHNTQIIATQWRDLFESVGDCKALLKSAHENVAQIEQDLKGVHEWLQIKESTMSRAKLYTTIDEMEISCSTISQIGMDAQNKRLFFDPLKFSAVEMFTGVSMTNIREFYSSLSTRVVNLWQTAEDLSINFRQNINLVRDIIANCESFLTWVKMVSNEVDGIVKPGNKEESIKVLSKLEDYIDLVPEREREFDYLVDRVKSLDNLASSLIIGHINQSSQEFNVLKMLLKKKHSIVSGLVSHFSAEEGLLKKIQDALQEAEKVLNSPMLIPCNIEGLGAINDRYSDISKQLERTKEMIDNLAEHSPELAAQLRERCLHASDEQHNVSLKVGEALGSLKSLHQQLDELIEWENHMIQKIGELNIPTGSKEEVLDLEEKVKELGRKIERQELTYNRLEDKANNVMIQFELGTGQEIEEKLCLMQELWRDITGSTAEHKSRVEKAIFHFDTFDSTVLNHEAFLQSQQSHFNFIKQNPENETAKERNEKLREELSNSSLLDDMTQALTQMKEMFPDVSVADEFAKLQTVKAHQECFVNKVEEHSKYLDERITASVYDNIPVQALLDWVRETREQEVLALEDNMPGSLEECELELDKHEKILQELAAKQKEVIKAQTEAEKLFQEKGLDAGVQKLAEEMKLLQKQWEDTTQIITKRQKVLEERLVTLGALSDDIEDQLSWITRTRQSIDEAEEPSSDLHYLIEEITLIKNIRSEVGEHGQDVTDVCSKGHEILSSSKNCDKLSARLRDLTDAWQELNDVARDRHILLQNSLQVLQKAGESETDALYNWLKEVSDNLGPPALPPNFTSEDILEMYSHVQGIRIKLDKKLVELTSHINMMKGKGPLKGKTKRLEQSLTHTLKRLSDQETYLREHQEIESQLDHLTELQGWLDQSQVVVEEISSLDSLDADQVRAAVQCYEQLKSDLETHVKDMDSLSGIPPECIPANYRTSLTEVLLQWDSLCQAVSDRQVDMGELGRALSSFDESIPYLTTVKDELSVKVSAISSESSNIDEISMKLQQHKLISREITKVVNSEQSRNLERILHSVNKILGLDNVFSQDIATFRSHWEMFVDTVNEQRNSLTEEKLEWKQFNDSCNSKMTWIKERQLEVEEMIRECESGSKENLHQNMETLRVLSKSFALYEEQIQQVAENSHKFTKCMKAQLEKLKEAWLHLGEKMEQANTLLDSSYTSDNFSQSLQTLFQWLGDKEQLPVLSSIIPKDLELLDKDTQSLKELFTELEKHAEKVEELVEMDTGTSDSFLVEQVELLEQRWNNICDIAAAREEEMKAIRTQLEAYDAEFVRVQMWLDTQEEKLTSMRGQVSSEAMLEQHLGYLDEFLKLETFAQAELLGLREAAKRLHGNNPPHKVSSALNKNSQRWNTLCQQAKSTKVNLQQRLRLVLRHRSDLDEVIKSLNEQLDDVETQLSYTEQLTDTKEVLIEKEKFIEKTIAILVNVEEDYNSLQKLMLSCPIELQETYTSHVNSIEDVYSKIVMRHKVAVQSVSDQVNIVNKYGQHLDDTTGRIVSLLIELQDKIPFSSSLEDITNNIEFFKTAVNKYKTLNAEVRSIQSDSIVVPFFKTDLKNVKDRLDALEKFSKQMMEVLLKGSDISTEFRDGIAKTNSFLQEISQEVETSITPFLASDTPQDLQSALNTIVEIKHCMNTRGHLIEDIENTLKKFDEYFNVEPLKTEYEEVCGSWFEQLHELDEMETKLSTNLSSKTFFQNQLAGLKATFQQHRDTLKSLEEVTTEVKLRAAIETLEKLLTSEKSLSEEINSVVLEGKNIIRAIDNMEDMKRIQLEVQSLQSAYRVIQNSISMKHKKFTAILGQLDEYKSLIQSHELFIESTQTMMENLSSVLDETVMEQNKAQLANLENSILDKRLEHDKIVNLAETVLRCLADESYLKETATNLKISWNKMNCAMTEAATSIENNSKTLKNLYNGIAMLKKETLEKSKMIVSTQDVSNDIAVLRQQHRQMKMTLKELDVFTSTVERIKLAVESSLKNCSEIVKKDLTERLEAFNDLWNTTKSQTESGFRDIDNRLGGVRRYQEQLSEEHAWYAAAEDRYTAIKHSAAEMDLNHVSCLTNELNLHTATVLDLRENIVKLNFDQTVIKECTSLISNYEDLKGRLEHLVSVFEAENSKTYKLISHIDLVQHQVYERGRNLASHQAVSSHYETVKYQSEQLEQFMETLSSVENDVVDLIRSNKNSSLPQEVQIKIQHLSESWNELAQHVSAREQKIRQMLQLLQQFEDSYNELSSWLHDKNNVLISSLPYDVDGVHSHHELLVSVKSTLNTKYHLIQIVTEVGNTLVTLSSAADVEHIQTKLHKIKQSYDKLENDISLAIEQANEAALGLQNFKHSVDNISEMLGKYEKVVEDLPNFGGAVEELASFIESHLSELDETYELVEKLQSTVRSLEDNIWSGDNTYLKNILLDINTRYKRVRSKLKSSHDRIHQSSVLADQFLGTIQNVMTWISDMSTKITVDLPADQEQLLDLASVFHPLNREVVAKETSIDLLIEKGAMLLAEGDLDDGHCTVIEEQLSKVRDLYDELKVKYRDHAKNLESALNMCNRYQNKIDSVMGKLSRYDTVFLGADKPDIDHISQQIQRLEQSKYELAEIENLIIEIESINVIEGGDASFSRRKLQLRTKLETVMAECESKIKTLQLYESKLKTIESDMTGLEQWINTSCDTLSGNLGANSTLLESVKLLDSEISVQKTHLLAVRRNTEKFLKEYKLVKQGALIQRLMTIEENFQELEDIIVERRHKCEEEEQQVAGFQEKMNNMFDWIHSKEQELASQSKVTLVKEQATAQLQDHIKMQQDFGTMQTHMDTLNTNWDTLLTAQQTMTMKQHHIKNNLAQNPMGFDLFTKFEERYPELDQQLATLNTMWENTCRGCVDRQRVLEESISSLDEFWTNYNDFRDWLRDSSEAMEVEPDPGATLLDQLNTVKELLRNLEEKKPTIDHLKELAGKIPSSILAQIEEEEAPLKTELEEAEEMLNNQVECLKSRKSRLEKGCAAVADYNEEVGELIIWLKEFEPKLNVSVQLDSTDPKEIKNLQGKQRVWMKTLAEKQGTYEELTEKGRELLDKSEESEQHGINAILLNLAEAWEQVGALVEEKRIKLEDGFQHAHQFDKHFKELSSWVQEAEAQVTEPMDDNDLHNRVERQQLLVSGLKENEARFDHIFVLGEGLISLCTPAASAPVSEKLESLQEQWESLKLHCVKEQETLKGTVDNMVEMKSKVDFYSQWVNDVVEHCSQLNEDLPEDLPKIRKMVDDFYQFTKELQNQAPFLNDLLEQCAVFEEQGTLSPDLTSDIEEVKDKWAEVCQFLDERFVEMRQKQLDLARQPAPKPAKEPKTDAEKVDLEVQNVVASCCCENKFKCEMVSAGKYKFGEMQKKHLVRILRTNIVVRVGGGWETMESFLNQHDPCRVTGKGNIESILANLPKPGEALGLMSANLTRNRTVIGYTDSTKSIAKTQSCSGTVESVVETETDTDFAHAKGTQRFASRNQKSSMSGKTTTRTPTKTTQRKMFTPVANSGKNGGNKPGRARSAASTSNSSLSSRSLTRSTSGLTPERHIPLRRSKSYGMGEPEPVTSKGRTRHPSGGSGTGNNTKVLSDRFSTFSPAKGIKKSESDSDIQKRRSGIPTPTRPSGIPVAKSRTGSLGRSPSGDLAPSRSTFNRSASLRGSKRSTPAKPRIVVTDDDDDETF